MWSITKPWRVLEGRAEGGTYFEVAFSLIVDFPAHVVNGMSVVVLTVRVFSQFLSSSTLVDRL